VIAAPLLALALLAPPAFRAEGGLGREVEDQAAAAWERFEALVAASGLSAPPAPRPIRIIPASELAPGIAAASRPGVILLRPGLPPGTAAGSVRHEVAHQLLFEACPEASGDRLFHEAFAHAASGVAGERRGADGDRYLPLAAALDRLSRSRRLDTPEARQAIARLLAEAPGRPGHLPASLARHLDRCAPGAGWLALRPEDLAGQAAGAADALVVLSLHSGEVLLQEGAASLPLPFGSTLKPFLVAGARATPSLAPDLSRPGWRCGRDLPARMDAATALLRSCNGWFLDWAAGSTEVVRFGTWGPALLALGLSALPGDASEAIGIRASLRISPLGLAHAYRLLAVARPDLVDLLSRTAREGTLAGLPASAALAGVAAKTGTVLDAAANPHLGWIAAVDGDVVVVMARAGMTPRAFAARLAATLARAREPARGEARVQVFGLVPTEEVTGRCQGQGFVAAPEGPRPVPDRGAPLLGLAASGPLLCAGGPWLVSVPGVAEPRSYGGIFTREPAPPPPPAADPATTPRQQRARRGSDLVFRTTRLLYATGVAVAEDAAARGEARIALNRVADANVGHSRHAGRAVCDTTHCQAFLGTRLPTREDRAALASPFAASGWLPFARGGTEPWREERPAKAVEAALGPGARALVFASGRVSFVADGGGGAQRWEERRDLPCEVLRGPLKLRSCPDRAEQVGDRISFEGRGQGHGEGLDLDWAKRSGLTAEEILARAYRR